MAIKTLNLFIFPRQTFARVAAAAARGAGECVGGVAALLARERTGGQPCLAGGFFSVAVRFGSMFALSPLLLLLLSVAYLGAHIENANTRTQIATPTCWHTHTLELNCFGSFCLAAASAPLFLSECRTSFILLLFFCSLPLSLSALSLMLILIPFSIPVPYIPRCSFRFANP